MTTLTHAGDGSGRLYATLQGGQIRVIQKGAVRTAPFLDLSALTKKTPKPGALEPAVLKAAENRGFGRDVVVVKPGGEPPSETTASGDGENQVQAKPKPSKPRRGAPSVVTGTPRSSASKPRVEVMVQTAPT